MRGFKKDHTLTALAREGMLSLFPGVMADSRSFVSLPKVTSHTDGKAEPHLVLWGRDKAAMRAEVFARNRLNNRGVNRCEGEMCNMLVSEEANGIHMAGEWDHLDSSPANRCDCAANGQVLCPSCHRQKHVKVEWSASV